MRQSLSLTVEATLFCPPDSDEEQRQRCARQTHESTITQWSIPPSFGPLDGFRVLFSLRS